MKGIEPSCVAWEATVLPLNYTRVFIVGPARAGAHPYRQFALIQAPWDPIFRPICTPSWERFLPANNILRFKSFFLEEHNI